MFEAWKAKKLTIFDLPSVCNNSVKYNIDALLSNDGMIAPFNAKFPFS